MALGALGQGRGGHQPADGNIETSRGIAKRFELYRTSTSHLRQRGVTTIEASTAIVLVGILAILAVPHFIKTTPKTDDTSAQANLVNAVIEVKSLYSIDQAYSALGAAYPTISFESQAPGFAWTTGSCAAGTTNCVSEAVVDVRRAGDSQGVVLAAWSYSTKTCWYLADLESVPAEIVYDSHGTAFQDAFNGNGPVRNAGLWYGRSPSGASSCRASQAVAGTVSHWGNSFSGAGVVGVG